MTNQDTLIQTISQAKCTIANMASDFVKQEKAGDDISCCSKKMRLLVRWVEILEDFNCYFYDTSLTDPYQCLTESEAMELVGKAKLLIS